MRKISLLYFHPTRDLSSEFKSVKPVRYLAVCLRFIHKSRELLRKKICNIKANAKINKMFRWWSTCVSNIAPDDRSWIRRNWVWEKRKEEKNWAMKAIFKRNEAEASTRRKNKIFVFQLLNVLCLLFYFMLCRIFFILFSHFLFYNSPIVQSVAGFGCDKT